MKYLLLFLFFNINYSQNTNDDYLSIITHINNYELQKASSQIKDLNNIDSNLLFQNQVDYLKSGNVSKSILTLDSSQFSYYLRGIYYIYLGDYYLRISGKFSKKAYQLYLKAYQLGQQYKNKSLQQESLRKMLMLFMINEMNFIQFSNYSERYLLLDNDFINTFWAKYFTLFKQYYEKSEYNKDNNFEVKSYYTLVNTANKNPFLKGTVYQIMGLCASVFDDYNLAKDCIRKAKTEYKKSNEFYSQKALKKVEFNEGYNYLKTNNVQKAITVFRQSEQSKYFEKDIKSKFLIEDALYKAYSAIKNKDSAIYYLNQKTAYQDSLVREENAIEIHKIDTEYQVQEKNYQISFLKQQFRQNKILYLSLIFGVFLLALYSFVRWKKEDKLRKKALIDAQSIKTEYIETLEELNKTKELVIQNHIILKNNSKVSLDDLLYIKAEDHYLQLFTSSKNEFVREKLSEIIKALPPNFVKCHRSYIINRNHIKLIRKNSVVMVDNSEIPISRGFTF